MSNDRQPGAYTVDPQGGEAPDLTDPAMTERAASAAPPQPKTKKEKTDAQQ